jgi:hypothetical protein
MATGGTPEAGMVFKIPTQRRGESVYAREYYDPVYEAQREDEADAYRQAAEKRAQESHDISMRAEARRQGFQDRQIERDEIGERALEKIDSLDPLSVHYEDAHTDLLAEHDIHVGLSNRNTRDAIKNALKENEQKHNEYMSNWQEYAQAHGYEGDMRNPDFFDAKGRYDWKKIGPIFQDSQRKLWQKQAMQAQQAQLQAQEAGYKMVMMPDGKARLVKDESVEATMGVKPTNKPVVLPEDDEAATNDAQSQPTKASLGDIFK